MEFSKVVDVRHQLARALGETWQVEAGLSNGRPVLHVSLRRTWTVPAETPASSIVAQITQEMGCPTSADITPR